MTVTKFILKCSNISIRLTSRVPVEGKSSVCVIYMKYRIIISLGQILVSYIANTSRMHARIHTRAHAHTHQSPSPLRLSLFDGSVHPTMQS